MPYSYANDSTNNYAKWNMIILWNKEKIKYLMNMHTCIFINDMNRSQNRLHNFNMYSVSCLPEDRDKRHHYPSMVFVVGSRWQVLRYLMLQF